MGDAKTHDDSQYLEEIKKLRDIIVENQGIIRAKDNFINDQKEQITQQQNELRTIKSQMEKEKEVEVQKLIHQNKLISQSFQSLSTQFQSAQENVRQLTTKLKEYEKTGGRNARQNNDTPTVPIETQDEIKQMKIQLDSYRKKIESLKLENEKQKIEYETTIEEKSLEHDRKIQTLKYEIEARDKQISYLQQDLNSDSSDDDDSESENNNNNNNSNSSKSSNATIKAQLQEQNAKVISLNSIIENLKAELTTKDKTISNLKSEMAGESGKSRQMIPQNIPNFINEINSLEKLNSELSATVQMLRDKVKQLEQELSISNERIRYYHDDLSAKNATIMQLNRKIKDQLLNAKLPPPKSSNAASVIAELRKELSKAQISNEALISRCATLSDEIQLLEKRFALSEKNRIESIRQREEQIDEIKAKYLEIRKLYYTSQDVNFSEIEEEIEGIKRDYFFAIAVGIKLNLNTQGITSNVDLNDLYENATKYIPYADWKTWLSKELQKSAPSPIYNLMSSMENSRSSSSASKRKTSLSLSPSNRPTMKLSPQNQKEDDIIEQRYQLQKNEEALKSAQMNTFQKRYGGDDDSSALLSFESMPSGGESSEESYF